jgi:tripartite ATP-independent transporter DctM subunit
VSSVTIGLLGIVFLLLAFSVGIPIAFAMAIVGFVGFATIVTLEAALNLLVQDIFLQLTSYTLSVLPMFILMGYYAFFSGIGTRLFGTAYTVLGQLRGGLAMASIAASAGFGAVCGSSTATCATIGKVALPEMRNHGYSDRLATGCITSSGGLGLLIPPSLGFVMYGLLTEQSISKLFISGIIPGILCALALMGTVWVICRRDLSLGPSGPRTSLKQKLVSAGGLIDALVLFALAMGGLFAGWFSPTQAAGIGCIGALGIGIWKGKFTWQGFWDATRDSLKISCMIMLIIVGATVFGHFMTVTRIPTELIKYVQSMNVPPVLVLIAVCIIWFILGCFIDATAIIMFLLPLVYPLVRSYGYDPIWFGVLVNMLGIVALVTPPVGMNAYVTKAIAEGVSLETVFIGSIPFLIPLCVTILLLFLFPEIATFLPRFISY